MSPFLIGAFILFNIFYSLLDLLATAVNVMSMVFIIRSFMEESSSSPPDSKRLEKSSI